MQLELVFIRHGQTAGNEQRRYIGQSDDQPLSEAGRAQLQEWQAAKKYPPADALYVAPSAADRDGQNSLSHAGTGDHPVFGGSRFGHIRREKPTSSLRMSRPSDAGSTPVG